MKFGNDFRPVFADKQDYVSGLIHSLKVIRRLDLSDLKPSICPGYAIVFSFTGILFQRPLPIMHARYKSFNE